MSVRNFRKLILGSQQEKMSGTVQVRLKIILLGHAVLGKFLLKTIRISSLISLCCFEKTVS